MKVLLLGCRGMLGTDLAATAPGEARLTGVGIEELDVTDHAAVAAALDRVRPDWVVNATAYTAVDRAETERDLAFAVNGDAVAALARACAARDIGVVHYGTDYVFDGNGTRPWREDDPTAPLNTYGASKLAGERALLESGARTLMLRTQWLYGLHGKSFPRTMWERARGGQATRVVSDQHGSPTYTVDLAHATWALVARGATGLFHATTGYSLPDAVRTAAMIAAMPDLSGSALHDALHDHARAAWARGGFYRLLDRLLFKVAEPAQRYKVLQRFYTLHPGLIGRFYAGRTTLLDKMRILAGKPPVPFFRAFTVLKER